MPALANKAAYETSELKMFPVDPNNQQLAWQSVQQECPILSDWGVTVLREGLDPFLKTIVLEPLYICKDHRNLFSNVYSKKFIPNGHICSRLHFFSENDLNAAGILLQPHNHMGHYMGFSVIRPISQRCLGRTIIDPYQIGLTPDRGFFLLRTEFKVNVNGTRYTVSGYPYTSQDADATVCAHSALWGVCRYLSERYPMYAELYPYDLIQMTETTRGRRFPNRGMTYNDYCSILTNFGAFPIFKITCKSSGGLDQEALKDVYAFVESGFPVLASLHSGTDGHVVTLIGHTLDLEKNITFDPNVFMDSSCFLKEFVIVDDNCFPYRLLGPAGGANYSPKYDLNKMVVITCPLPEKVFLVPKYAREKAVYVAMKKFDLIRKTGNAPYITRLFITTGTAFKKRKLCYAYQNNPDAACQFVAGLHLPHFIWVMEISPFAEYIAGRCTGELVMDATAGRLEDGLVYIRIGNEISFSGKETLCKTVAESPSVFPMFTHNLGVKADPA